MRAQFDDRSVGKQNRQRFDIIKRLAIHHGSCTGRIIGNHATDRGPVARRNIQRQLQPIGPQKRVQLIQHNPRL